MVINNLQYGGGNSKNRIPLNNGKRDSRFELIRIVAMSLIIIHHFIVHSITKETLSPIIFNLVNPYFYTGVNIFFLISGWFLINFSFKRCISFILLILFYDLINCLLCVSCDVPISHSLITDIILFPISRSSYWFIKVYLFLMLTAPLINEGLKKLTLKQLRIIVLCLTFATLYSCNLGENITNEKGHSYFQAFYLYIVGYYIHSDKSLYDKLNKTFCLIGYFLLLCLSSLLIIYTPFYMVGRYNSFALIGSATLLFIFLSKIKLKNNYFINVLGASSLGCYLLQDGIFGKKFFYSYLHNFITSEHSIISIIILLLVIFIIFWLISIAINPLIKNISNLIASILIDNKYFKSFKQKIWQKL